MQYIITKRKSIINGEAVVSINGKQQKIRYAPGEDSIYVNEQSKLAKRKHIAVLNGMIATTDSMQDEYLQARMKDPKSAKWIKVYDAQKVAKEHNLKDETMALAMAHIVSSDLADLSTVAYMLGGRTLIYNANGTAKSPEEIKKSLYPIAKIKPDLVKDSFEKSDDKKMEFMVSQAFFMGIIEYNPSTNKVIYADSQQTLLNLKEGMGTDVEQVAVYFKTQEGKKDLNDVKNYFGAKASNNDFSEIDGIGKATAKKMREAGLRTFQDVKNLTEEVFGEKMKEAGIKFVGNSYEDIYKALIK